jgi:DNA-directed RNA polymerase specialized sigma24 family protein
VNPEDVFLEHLGWINRVAAMACSRYGLWGSEAEDFTSWVQIKLMDDDYAVLRHFRGESGLKTYLASVVTRQFQEYRRQRFGRWRPSAEARRLGSTALHLEALVRRDGYRLDQAGERLRTGGLTTQSDAELARILARLPERDPLRPVELQNLQLNGPKAPLPPPPGPTIFNTVPFQLALDPTGKHLYVVNHEVTLDNSAPEANQLHVLKVQPDGLLTESVKSPLIFSQTLVPARAHPLGVVVV